VKATPQESLTVITTDCLLVRSLDRSACVIKVKPWTNQLELFSQSRLYSFGRGGLQDLQVSKNSTFAKLKTSKATSVFWSP